jgi:hypothetical protein
LAKVREPEEQTRIELFLPCNDENQLRAMRKIALRLGRQQRAFTRTTEYPPVMVGRYYEEKGAAPIDDKIIWLFVDVQERLGSPTLTNYLNQLADSIQKHYTDAGSPRKQSISLLTGSGGWSKLIGCEQL